MEKMTDFFTARAKQYEEHMLSNVTGCKEAYVQMAQFVPESSNCLLDLGCGTGLELDEIFKQFPKIHVTGIDLTQAMLDQLHRKHEEKSMKLICGSYFDISFGEEEYDCAVSVQTMHHFSHKRKLGLYKKIVASLKDNGLYIECDYMVEKQEEEEFYYSENMRIRKELGISEDACYHYDTPCTIKNQIFMLKKAGFRKVNKVFRIENTTILIAYK